MTNKQVGIDFLKIIVIYGVYWTLIYLAATYNVPGSLGVIYHSPNGQVANEEVHPTVLDADAQSRRECTCGVGASRSQDVECRCGRLPDNFEKCVRISLLV